MEFYTILAEKEHMINALENKEQTLLSKMNDVEAKYDQIEKIARDGSRKQEEFKEIINKMNQKVNEA